MTDSIQFALLQVMQERLRLVQERMDLLEERDAATEKFRALVEQRKTLREGLDRQFAESGRDRRRSARRTDEPLHDRIKICSGK